MGQKSRNKKSKAKVQQRQTAPARAVKESMPASLGGESAYVPSQPVRQLSSKATVHGHPK